MKNGLNPLSCIILYILVSSLSDTHEWNDFGMVYSCGILTVGPLALSDTLGTCDAGN